jgi:hypothetical protein
MSTPRQENSMNISYVSANIELLEMKLSDELAELRALADNQKFAWELDIDGGFSGPTRSERAARQDLEDAVDELTAAKRRLESALDALGGYELLTDLAPGY